MLTYLVCLGGLALLVGAVTFALLETHIDQGRAERLIGAFQEITVSSTDGARASDLTSSSRSYRSDATHVGLPQWIFHYDNRRLVKLHLAPYTTVDASLTFRNGVAVEKEVTVFIASGFWGTVIEGKRGFGFLNDITTNEDPSHSVIRTCDPPNNVRNIEISDDDSYGETERHTDWAVKVDCLTKLGGCKDARSILPNAHSSTPYSDDCGQ